MTLLMTDIVAAFALLALAAGMRTVQSFTPSSPLLRKMWSRFSWLLILCGLGHAAHHWPEVRVPLREVTAGYSLYVAVAFLLRMRPAIIEALNHVHALASFDTLERDLRRHRKTFYDAPLGIIHVDAEGRIIECNRAFARWLHSVPEWFEGRRFIDLVHPDDVERTLEAFKKHGAHGAPLTPSPYPNRYIARDGTVVTLNWLDGAGAAVGDEALVAWCFRFALVPMPYSEVARPEN